MAKPLTLNITGCGLKTYGSALRRPDRSFVVTQWLVFLWIPILPLGSYRLWTDTTPWWKFKVARSQTRAASVPLHQPQVWKGYVVTLLFGAFFVFIHFLSRGK
jgi:hypothetical protein